MRLRPTPETDAAEHCIDEIPQFPFVSSKLARRLERERDNYREQADGYLVRLGETQERMIDAERERDEMTLRWERTNDALFQAREQWRMSSICRELNEQLDAERALADRLAGFVSDWREGYGGQIPDAGCDCGECETIISLDAALDAWKEARK